MTLPLSCPVNRYSQLMGQPATLVVDSETVGQDPEIIAPRAREILLDVESDEDRLKVLDTRRFSTERHFDVREVLTNFERYRKGTLEFFCEIFGVNSPKNGINGSKVGDYFKQGRLDEIAHYCLADCKATGELFQRLKNYYR